LKIAIVVNSFPEFSETFIINKVLELAKANNQIEVFSLNGTGNKDLFKLYHFHQNPNVKVNYVFLPKNILQLIQFCIQNPVIALTSFNVHPKTFFSNLKQKKLVKIFNNNFNIVHFEYSGLAASLLHILPHINSKLVVSCRGSAEKVKPLTDASRKEKLTQLFNLVHGIHCVSTDMVNTIAPYCKNLHKTFVNRPAIDASFFTPKIKNATNVKLQLLTIGRFTFQKGYLLLLMVAKKLVENNIDFEWNIIGDGPQKEELIFHIHTIGLEQYVKLVGKKNKDEVNQYLTSTHVFVLTSVYEGIPNVVLEAMAMQIPVVTTKCGGVDEVIENGVDGFITPLYDVEAITQKIIYLYQNPALQEQMGKNARNKILEAYTLQRQVNVFLQQYNLIVNNSAV
jgi:colanic acid/amylovoran biosynthesis glycosyltransferase